MEKTSDENLALQIAIAKTTAQKRVRLTPGGYRVIDDATKLTTQPDGVLSADPYLQKRMGWLPDVPDFRDYGLEHDQLSAKEKSRGKSKTIKEMVAKTGIQTAKSLPSVVDLRKWFSPVEDQGNLGSCTAHAGISLYEYYERRAFGKHIDASHLFLYKATRNLMHETGDTGAYLRTTMGAMALFGIPPEEFWPYRIQKFDEEPSAFCYAFAQNFQAISYARLDQTGLSQEEILDRIKRCLAAGIPSMFGFTVYDSIYQGEQTGKIPFPASNDAILGGHAVAMAGYDDNLKITNSNPGGPTTKGAFIVRNSWGTSFGDSGYCYLPYDFVRAGIADDFWIMLKAEWVNTGQFKM